VKLLRLIFIITFCSCIPSKPLVISTFIKRDELSLVSYRSMKNLYNIEKEFLFSKEQSIELYDLIKPKIISNFKPITKIASICIASKHSTSGLYEIYKDGSSVFISFNDKLYLACSLEKYQNFLKKSVSEEYR